MVTLSDASLVGVLARVLLQKMVCTEGEQAPSNFTLLYSLADAQPSTRTLLSAAIAVNGQLTFITDIVQTIINQGGTYTDLMLAPVMQAVVLVAQ